MVLIKPHTLSILVVFKKTIFLRIFFSNSHHKKSLAMTSCKKTLPTIFSDESFYLIQNPRFSKIWQSLGPEVACFFEGQL